MRALPENPSWGLVRSLRKRQKLAGRAAGILLLVALLALFDGLAAQMRAGPNELNLLPGESLSISGPAVLKNPLNSDIIAAFRPADAPLAFNFEGFFTGYWFGNGMWRGQVAAPLGAEPGAYGLRIAFRGASAKTAQNYTFKVYENREAMRAASLSFITRLSGANPFILAAVCGACGILCGMATYYFGRRYARNLDRLGLAEIYRVDETDGGVWCLSPLPLAPRPGASRLVLDEAGERLGEARAEEWRKGKLRLTMLDGPVARAGALVCLSPRWGDEKVEKTPDGAAKNVQGGANGQLS